MSLGVKKELPALVLGGCSLHLFTARDLDAGGLLEQWPKKEP